MSFTIDRQSQDELNLMGKFRQGSVYAVFNQVKTRSGEQLLDQLFRNPMTDAAAINQRTAVFRFFVEAGLQFPFDPRQVTLMQEYIDGATSQSRMGTLGTVLLKKSLSTLTRDERYKTLIQGLQATIMTLKKCVGIVELLHTMQGPISNEQPKSGQFCTRRNYLL
ncbi:hypothetical protein FSB84_10555 [Pseudobacter ginsenosidimutans]|uniref:hypothetical protein n=1 Tax=Pseudobacter ginsenosidimutans TaxID=661488 RepID=UPI0011BB3A7F|nr:hypothetical protein [Pseudobacter ginsenosidimutans]QEC42106.1 hypothetical protein FSB84_10555 [Pseudobacter ginsenosidimutans]